MQHQCLTLWGQTLSWQNYTKIFVNYVPKENKKYAVILGQNPREFHIWSLEKERWEKEKNKESMMVQNSGEDKCFQKWHVNSIEYSACAVLCKQKEH